jgi:hypothetical protein
MPRKNVWVTEEVEKLIKELDINLSGYINDELPLRYNPTRFLRSEIKKTEKRLKRLNQKLKKLEQEMGRGPTITDEMISTLKDMNEKLKANPHYFTGMLKRFRNEFTYHLTKREFAKLLRRYGDNENPDKEGI